MTKTGIVAGTLRALGIGSKAAEFQETKPDAPIGDDALFAVRQMDPDAVRAAGITNGMPLDEVRRRLLALP